MALSLNFCLLGLVGALAGAGRLLRGNLVVGDFLAVERLVGLIRVAAGLPEHPSQLLKLALQFGLCHDLDAAVLLGAGALRFTSG